MELDSPELPKLVRKSPEATVQNQNNNFLSFDDLSDDDQGKTAPSNASTPSTKRKDPFQARMDRMKRINEMSKDERLEMFDDVIDDTVICSRTPVWFLKASHKPEIASLKKLGFYVDEDLSNM
jgi:hypothetical protein